jgi:hypothetical protein
MDVIEYLLGFPNVVPTTDEWGDCLPRFIGDDHDNPTQHLINFHQYMIKSLLM